LIKHAIWSINAIQDVWRFFACVLKSFTFSKKRKLNAFGFQKQRGFYLNKSFYSEKLRVSFIQYKLFIGS